MATTRQIRIAATAFALSLFVAPSASAQLQVVANRSFPGSSVSRRDLAHLFRGEYGDVGGPTRTILVDELGVRRVYVKALLQMSEDQFKRHWIRVVFSGAPVAPPQTFATAQQVIEFVAATPGAIALMSYVPTDQVKVLAVDGLLPNDPRYPLREQR